jgi:phosphoglycolate phosphatase-like HAD superfamily hydrolase
MKFHCLKMLAIHAAVANAFAPSLTLFNGARGRSAASTNSYLNAEPGNFDFALIFDCDGVIIETEELHRLAYNAAFKAAGLKIDGNPVEWSVEYYDVLQNTVGGGKNKMFFHFRSTTGAFPTFIDGDVKPAPETEDEQQALVDNLQAHKTELYKDLIAEKATPRPGVIELMDEALADPRTAVGVCSASTKAAVVSIDSASLS